VARSISGASRAGDPGDDPPGDDKLEPVVIAVTRSR
jgi:hypothetical protein